MASIWMPDAPPASPGAEDDEFDGNSGGVPPGWTEYDHGSSATVIEREWGLEVSRPTAGGDQQAGIYRAIPAGDFTITCRLGTTCLAVANYSVAALALFQDATSSTGDLHIFADRVSAIDEQVIVERWSAYNAWSAAIASSTLSSDADSTAYVFRIRRNGTTYTFEVSSDGMAFQRFYTTAALGYVPAHFGMVINNVNQGVTTYLTATHFRYIASDVGLNDQNNGQRITITPL